MRIANRKFDKGPANETIASSLKGLLNWDLFTGTGLAHPINIKPEENASIGITILPIRSICFKGFNVSLPILKAVLSPNLNAEYACAYS